MRLYGGFSVRRALSSYGWAVSLLVATLALLVALVGLPEAGIDVTPTRDDVTIKVVPASGIEGFKVAVFCSDPQTKVTALPAPDATGLTYQLLRIVNGVTETVVWVTGTRTATHYYDSTVGQQSEPAIISDAAKECVERRSQ